MIKVIIVDDEKHCAQELCLVLSELSEVEILGEARTVKEGIELIKKHSPNLVFLDIELPDGSGFDLLEAFRETNFQVIFVTGHNDYAIKAFKHNAIDYLLKPIDPLELKSAVEKAKPYLGSTDHYKKLDAMLKSLEQKEFSKIVVPSMDSFEFLFKKDVWLCESDGNYTNIYLSDGKKVLCTLALKRLEEILTEKNFFRVHKSYIININAIKKIFKTENGHILLENNLEVPIARRRRDEFFQFMGL
ncbi:MAG: response regulator transcription factor [Chitinophagales bacterium]|nr:response regulator transcription factor [Bacteroidota bacterium]MCB9256326.1 response regulator transcription factor [Chitinophagales bacterium]